jgi:hypothetical protein
MRRASILLFLIVSLAAAVCAEAATGRVIKVLPQYLDLKGRASLSPSLYDRDAYQVVLRQHPDKRSGIRFMAQWKTRGRLSEPLRLQLELRGAAQAGSTKQRVLEQSLTPSRWLSGWTTFTLSGDDYRDFGEVTAWRATLWEGSQLLGEKKSFLW